VRQAIFYIGVLFLSACNLSDKNKPANLLSKTQMATILSDLHVAEAQSDHQFGNRDTARIAFTILEKQIFENHGVVDSVFRQSYDYYLLHLKDMDQIYAGVIDTLNLRELKAQQRDTVRTYPGAHPPAPAKVNIEHLVN
jgi:hypothetical protein